MNWTAEGSVMSLIRRANEGSANTRWRADVPLDKMYDMTALNTSRAATDTHPSPILREQSFNTLKYEMHLNTTSKFILHLSQNTTT
jgi:hypothetical protein